MFPQLEETIHSQLDGDGLTGLAIALVRGDEVVWQNAYGVADVESGAPATTDMSFAIMSVTKTIVSTAVMQLRDEGHFALDDPVNGYLAPVQIQNDWEADSPVRVGQLMTHTSGLPVSGFYLPGKQPLDAFVSSVARCERRPGEAIIYANWGFDALGVLIARCSGLPADAYLRERIFTPLGMRSAVLGDPPEGAPRATGHYGSWIDGRMRTLPLPEWGTTMASPAGGCWMTVTDLAQFVAAHLSDGAGLLSPPTTAEMHRLRVRQGASESGMGIGFRVTRSNGRRLICHGGDGGGFTAFIGAYPEERVGVALLINTAGTQVARAVIGNSALEALAGEAVPRSFSISPIREGKYKSTFWEMVLEARAGESPTLTITEAPGTASPDEVNISQVTDSGDGRWEGVGGMFHGFEVFIDDENIYGGVYPFTFERVGDLREPDPIDEAADLTGRWTGKITTPMGEMMASLDVSGPSHVVVNTPLTPNVPLEAASAAQGRLEGEFEASLPGLGDLRIFLRLAARGGRLVGNLVARGHLLGEAGMRVEFERT